MSAGTKALASQFNSLYTKLNQARTRVGLGNQTYTSATAGSTKMTSAQMKTLQTHISTARTNKYLAKSTAWSPGGTLDVGQKILYSTFSTVDAVLNSMKSVCVYDSIHGTHSNFTNFGTNDTYSDFGANGTFGNFGANGTCGTDPHCGANAVYDNFSTSGNGNNDQHSVYNNVR